MHSPARDEVGRLEGAAGVWNGRYLSLPVVGIMSTSRETLCLYWGFLCADSTADSLQWNPCASMALYLSFGVLRPSLKFAITPGRLVAISH